MLPSQQRERIKRTERDREREKSLSGMVANVSRTCINFVLLVSMAPRVFNTQCSCLFSQVPWTSTYSTMGQILYYTEGPSNKTARCDYPPPGGTTHEHGSTHHGYGSTHHLHRTGLMASDQDLHGGRGDRASAAPQYAKVQWGTVLSKLYRGT